MSAPLKFDIRHTAPSFSETGAVHAPFGDFVVNPTEEGTPIALAAGIATAGLILAIILRR